MDRLNRRGFVASSARVGLAAGAWAASPILGAIGVTDGLFGVSQRAAAADAASAAPGPRIGGFTKSFQDLPIPEVCRRFKQLGLDGLDLTVRPQGHIEPEQAARELPQAAAAAKQEGLEILFLTTAVTDADEAADRLLGAAAEQGIRRIKLGYYRYQPFGTLAGQLAEVRKRLAGVAQLAAKHQVLPCVHIHSGPYLPSHGTQLYELLRDFSPQQVGAYLDTGHMAVEGGGDGWRQGIDLLAPWIALVAVKNFAWEVAGRDERGQQRWRTKTVPIADGVCPLPEYLAALKKVGYAGIYSLHSEYKGAHSFQDLSTEECLQQTATDLQHLRSLL